MEGDNDMKLKQSVQLLLIALFVWTYQSITIHAHHHVTQEEVECHLCHAAKQLDLNHHENILVIVNEYIAVEVTKTKEKIIKIPRFTNFQKLQVKAVDLEGKRCFNLSPDTVGYYSTAPPVVFHNQKII